MNKITLDQLPDNVKKDILEVNEIADELSKENNRVRIPEKLFVEYFLPLMTHMVNDDRPYIKEWVALAGSPTAEVEVVTPDGELIVIPPMFNTDTVTKLIDDDTKGLSEILTEASDRIQVMPAKGINYLNANLANTANSISAPYNYNDAWKDILVKYNIIKPTVGSLLDDAKDDDDDLFKFD